MQRMGSMDKTVKFTYVMIIFVFLFLIATNVEGNYFDSFWIS